MVRNFEARPVPADLVQRVLDAGRRAPSAGYSQGAELLVLEGAQETGVYWGATTTPEWWERNPDHAGLKRAPVVVLPLAGPGAYVRRYSEPDKAGSGLHEVGAWPVPYWYVDAAFSVMAMLLAVVDAGLGALFMGIFRGEQELLAQLGVPEGLRPIGALLIGWPAPDKPSPSLARGRRPEGEVIHRGRYRS